MRLHVREDVGGPGRRFEDQTPRYRLAPCTCGLGPCLAISWSLGRRVLTAPTNNSATASNFFAISRRQKLSALGN